MRVHRWMKRYEHIDAEKQNLEAWVPCHLTPASHSSIHVHLKNSRASMHKAGLNFSSSSSQHICGPLVKTLWSTDLKTLTSIIWFIFTSHCFPLNLQIRTTILVLLEWPVQDVGLSKEKDITNARIFFFLHLLSYSLTYSDKIIKFIQSHTLQMSIFIGLELPS